MWLELRLKNVDETPSLRGLVSRRRCWWCWWCSLWNADGGRRDDFARGGRDLLARGCARASSAVRCDRDPGAVRLAAVEPDDAVAGEARWCYNSIPGSYHRTEEKGVWHRPATDTNTCRRQEVVWITSQTRSGGAIWLHTVVLRWNADSLRQGKVSRFHPVPRSNRPESCRGAISPPPPIKKTLI